MNNSSATFRSILKKYYLKFNSSHPFSSKMSSSVPQETEKCTVAVCQMTSTNNKRKNYEMFENLVLAARKAEAKMVFFPECCDFISDNRDETIKLSESLDGPLMSAYKLLARDNEMWISVGGFHEQPTELKADGKTYNTHVLIDASGKIQALYRKLHMFDVSIPEQNVDLRESALTVPGENITMPVDTPAGKLGMCICYDLRFPEQSTLLKKYGADILTYPSAFTKATGEAHWEYLLRARAIENQCFVIAAAQSGVHNVKRTTHGHAMIVDPWGKIIAQCSPFIEGYSEQSSMATADICLTMVDGIQKLMPVMKHRREDVYNLKLVNEEITDVEMPTHYKFSDKSIPIETVFHESTLSFAFTNIRCVLPGHVLVASKRVVPRLQDLTTDEIADLFNTAVRVQCIMEKVHNAHSTTVVVQDGKDAGQTIPHVHIHILPRKEGDFKRNDDVYDVLAKHDTPESKTPIRELADMIGEAIYLKHVIKLNRH